MSAEIRSGKLKELQKDYIGGWFVGGFVKKDSPFHTGDFEIKIAEHNAGEVKESTSANENGQKTLGILLEGAFKMAFPGLGKEITLDEKEQYIYFNPSIPRHFTALKDTKILIVRWPSEI